MWAEESMIKHGFEGAPEAGQPGYQTHEIISSGFACQFLKPPSQKNNSAATTNPNQIRISTGNNRDKVKSINQQYQM